MITGLMLWYIEHWYLFALAAVIALFLAGTERQS